MKLLPFIIAQGCAVFAIWVAAQIHPLGSLVVTLLWIGVVLLDMDQRARTRKP